MTPPFAGSRDRRPFREAGGRGHVVLRPSLTPVTNQCSVVCFPWAGGGLFEFGRWHSENLCFHAVALPGRERLLSQPPYDELAQLAYAAADALEPAIATPFAFFGHSMGAVVAFEVARELRRRRWPLPSYLIVSGHAGPASRDVTAPLHTLPDEALIARLRVLDGTPHAVLKDNSLLKLVLPTFRSDLKLCETYVYKPEEPLDCPILVLYGDGDGAVDRLGLQSWARETARECRFASFGGGHFFFREHREELIALLEDLLVSNLESKQ